MNKFICLILLLANPLTGHSAELEKSQPANKITCQLNKDKIQFEGASSAYQIYERSSHDLEVLECHKAVVAGKEFFTALTKSVVTDARGDRKILTYEIATLGKSGVLKTARSEIIDEVRVIPDTPNEFSLSMEAKWGQSKSDKSPLVQLTIKDVVPKEDEGPYTFLIKFNEKVNWFENVPTKK